MASRSRKNVLWATTRYGAHEIRIYLNPRMSAQTDGLTIRTKRQVCIELNAELIHSPSTLDETLIHEFLHVLEYFESPEAFDPREVNNCCRMVQTISKGVIQMLREMRQVGVE